LEVETSIIRVIREIRGEVFSFVFSITLISRDLSLFQIILDPLNQRSSAIRFCFF